MQAGVSELVLTAHAGWNGERTRGSSALEDWPDVIVTMNKDEATGQRFIRAEGRDVDVDEDGLHYDPATRLLSRMPRGPRTMRGPDGKPLVYDPAPGLPDGTYAGPPEPPHDPRARRQRRPACAGAQAVERRGNSVPPLHAATPPALGSLLVLVRQQRLVRLTPEQAARTREQTGPPCSTCGATWAPPSRAEPPSDCCRVGARGCVATAAGRTGADPSP